MSVCQFGGGVGMGEGLGVQGGNHSILWKLVLMKCFEPWWMFFFVLFEMRT